MLFFRPTKASGLMETTDGFSQNLKIEFFKSDCSASLCAV
jgi:hypothetical protein